MWHIAFINAERGVVCGIQAMNLASCGIRSANKFTFTSSPISLARLFAPQDESKDGRCDKNRDSCSDKDQPSLLNVISLSASLSTSPAIVSLGLTCLVESALIRLLELALVGLFCFPETISVSGPPSLVLIVIVLPGLLSTLLSSIEHRDHSLKLNL